MSNILATVGRNVQYVGTDGRTRAAVITDIYPNGQVELAVFTLGLTAGIQLVKDAKEFSAQAREVQANVYKLTWQGR
jgi:hypothetical protein